MRWKKGPNISHQIHIAKCTEKDRVNYNTEHKNYGSESQRRLIVKVLIKKDPQILVAFT